MHRLDLILSTLQTDEVRTNPTPQVVSPYKQVLSKMYQRIAVSALIWPRHCSPETLTLQQHCGRHFCIWQRLVYLALKVQSAVWEWIDVDPVHLLRTWITWAGSCRTPLFGSTCCKLCTQTCSSNAWPREGGPSRFHDGNLVPKKL